MRLLEIAGIGIGATLCIDLWALFLKKAFGMRSLDYCLLGRWVLHMPAGRVMHDSIGAAAAKPHECKVGWSAHYSIGIALTITFVVLMSDRWLSQPTFLPALAFGLATVAIPFFTMQPAFGLGIAASRTQNPAGARLKSLGTHATFGAGLYVSAWVLSHLT
jgi:hypothetical protein